MDATSTPRRKRRTTPPPGTFGAMIADARARKGLTQGVLGERTGVARSTIVRLETRPDAVPTPHSFRAVCSALDLPPADALVRLGYLTDEDLADVA